MEYFELANGVRVPAVGLGTFPMSNKAALAAVRVATHLGYELFDTSTSYGNERGVGWGRWRRTSFITTKVSNRDQRSSSVREAFFRSAKMLHADPIDLYLLHWPQPGYFEESWRVLEDLYLEGHCRAIGVANFHVHHLQQLMLGCRVAPLVNQVEIHPLLTQKDILKFCKSNGILCEAYSPFARMDPRVVDNETINHVSAVHGKSPTQVILRWHFQNGVVSIPKTSSPKRMRANIDIFDFQLSGEEMHEIDLLNEGYRVRHDPDTCDYSKL